MSSVAFHLKVVEDYQLVYKCKALVLAASAHHAQNDITCHGFQLIFCLCMDHLNSCF
jgi:hypothetical protein